MVVVGAVTTVEGPAESLERGPGASGERDRLAGLLVGAAVLDEEIGTEPVLQEVVRQQQAPVVDRLVDVVAQRRRAHRVVVEGVGVLPPRAATGVEQPAAFVEVCPQLEHLVVGERRRTRAAGLTGFTGQQVVARVPHDGVVMAEHAGAVRRDPSARVDVV